MNRIFPNRRIRNERKIFFIPLFILLVLLLGALVLWLWNAILPEVLGVKPLKYPQALGLLVLCKILFGNFGWKRHGGSERFKQELKDKLTNMSEEDKKKFKEEWRRRCHI